MNNLSIEEILRQYFREVVDQAIEKSPEGIVEFAERSRKIRNKSATLITQRELQSRIDELRNIEQDMNYMGDQVKVNKRLADLTSQLNSLQGE